MNRLYFLIALIGLVISTNVNAQSTSYHLEQNGSVRFPYTFDAWNDTVGGSDVWGFVDPGGTEYALMGVYEGVAVVRTSDMQVIQVVPGPQMNDSYYHRDIVTYSHYAFITNENTGFREGLMILDLQYLPDSVQYVGSYTGNGEYRSHNLSIDTTTGYAYVLKQNYNGVRILNLSDPENPKEDGLISVSSVHDVYARNDTAWVAEGSGHSFSVWDVTDKTDPMLITRVTPPNAGYAHNIWPLRNSRYFATTEETDYRTVKIWDMASPDSTHIIGEYLGDSNLAHNVHIKDDLMVISHYESGVSVVDISDPYNPVELAVYDTYPAGQGPNFHGCWGAYPFAPSGKIYTSDIEGYLRVLTLTQSTGVQGVSPTLPSTVMLLQNYPNPFNMETTISYRIPRDGTVSVTIFDQSGRQIRSWGFTHTSAGQYSFSWDGYDETGNAVASGVYIFRMRYRNNTTSQTEQRKLLLIK